LLVEDDKLLLRAMVRTLRNRVALVTATTAAEALERLEQGSITAVLTDYDLEDRAQNGAWLLGQVCARYPLVRRGLMTGNALITKQALGDLAEVVLHKPFAMDDIVHCFHRRSEPSIPALV